MHISDELWAEFAAEFDDDVAGARRGLPPLAPAPAPALAWLCPPSPRPPPPPPRHLVGLAQRSAWARDPGCAVGVARCPCPGLTEADHWWYVRGETQISV